MKFIARLARAGRWRRGAGEGRRASKSVGPNAVTLLLTAGTDFRGGDFEATTAKQLAGRGGAGRSTNLRQRHVDDFHELFSRVTHRSRGRENVARRWPTDERLVRMAERRRRSGARGAVLSTRPISADLQLAAGRHGGEFAGHLGRGDPKSRGTATITPTSTCR